MLNKCPTDFYGLGKPSHGKRVAVVISPEEYDQFAQLKLQSLKAILAESIAQADRGELHSIDDVFAPLTVDELGGKA
ncbi:hypothetical protein [Photorhabdus antumapuensis]|uniref:hypothetical protein n=1 Tax=Photorhabdus antumapuensis TaxID=2862867 RepID=UPI001CED3CDB|nr:hypothetical protein [Photorhabdus antumapuensis]MCA6220469.1 hypothetical protein [Photorhabdus antumapuensis]